LKSVRRSLGTAHDAAVTSTCNAKRPHEVGVWGIGLHQAQTEHESIDQATVKVTSMLLRVAFE
jgi:hypothetical protein